MPPKNMSEIFGILKEMNANIASMKDSVAALDKKVDLQTQKTEFQFNAIKTLDDQQNTLLKEHHDRSNQLKKDNELREQGLRTEIKGIADRVDSLEAPKKWLTSTWAIVLYASLAAGVIMKLVKFFQFFDR